MKATLFRGWRAVGAGALCCVLAAGCGPQVAGIAVSLPSSGPVERGTAVQLSAQLTDAQGMPVSGKPVTWTSSDPAVAEVSAQGLLTARQRGSANITASAEGVTGQLTVQVAVLYRSITAGGHHSCDVASGGVASCWGRNGFGALGVGDEQTRLVPADVRGGHPFASVSAYGHTCGVTTTGAAYCWGSNSVGQGGVGRQEGPFLSPERVAGDHNFVQIAAGGDHTCAVTSAGQAYCWGGNSSGQLGIGSTVSQALAPTLVVGGLTFKSVTAGVDFSCGVTTSGAAYCWGTDHSGQLGDGGPITYNSTSLSRVPVAVAGGLSFSVVSAGFLVACGVTTGGVGHCWGRNDAGRLGNGGTSDASAPVPVAGGLSLSTVAVGASHSCGITTAGAAHCWGGNNAGELGVSEPADLSRVPRPVSGGLAFSEIAVGRNSGSAHSCGITADRLSVYCWGLNDYGQLGNNTTSNRRQDVPVRVSGQHP